MEKSKIAKTALHEYHLALGAKMVDFASYRMPLQYTSIVEEHLWVREHCGLFDVSHMGKIVLTGTNADVFLDRLCPTNIHQVKPGRVIYSVLLRPDASPVDDVLFYRRATNEWFMVVNAVNLASVMTYLAENAHNMGYSEKNVIIQDVTEENCQLAIQGPKAEGIVGKLLQIDLKPLVYYHFMTTDQQPNLLISRTGYTGEDGFEIYGPPKEITDLWQRAVAMDGLRPIGLGARDTLRLESRFPLYGHELIPGRNIMDSSLSWIVSKKKTNYIGWQSVVLAKKSPGWQIAAYRMLENGIPRRGYALLDEMGQTVGEVTSGGYSPVLRAGIFLAFVPKAESMVEKIMIRDRALNIQRVMSTFVPNRTQKGKAGL